MKRIMVRLRQHAVWGTVLAAVVFALLHAVPVAAEMPLRSVVTSRPQAAPPQVRWHRTLRAGWQEARQRNLPMVIYISSDHCAYCDAMKRDTWSDRSVEQRVSQDFVAILLTPRENAETLGRVNVAMYPTTLIGMPEGKIVAHRAGYQPAAALHQFLSNALKR
ncbi:MAG: thioredoxin family protein [Novipirellula sp. JB048]